ncbi:FBX48 protein, partial [Atractosteus spatula]|nr:FBX48 protein [Atractosteus spatula]
MQYVSKRNRNTSTFSEGSCSLISREGQGYNFAEILPPEISLEIFSKLDVKSLCSAAVTCKLWNNIIENSDHLWRNHCLTVRAICQREVDEDRGDGFSWKVTLVRNYWKGCVKREWLSGRYSNIRSSHELPNKSMYPLDAETWGKILEAELER